MGGWSGYCRRVDEWTGVDFWTVGIAAAAALVAVGQALIAWRARKDALKASAAAGAHEAAALQAATDSADALAGSKEATDRIAAVLEAAQAGWRPWSFIDLGGGHLKWLVRNETGHRVNAWLSFPDATRSQILTSELEPGMYRSVGPGETLSFTWERRGPAARTDAVVAITWWLPGETPEVFQDTLIWPDA